MQFGSLFRSKSSILVILVLVAMMATQCAPAAPVVAPQPVVQTVVVQQTVMVAGTPQVKEVVVTATPPPAGKKVLRIANAEPTQGTSPLTGGTNASARVWELMHDPLWDRDEKFQAVPWLAEKWEANADSSQWTFKLQQGLTFSDGSPITADDVKASFEYLAKSDLWKVRVALIKSVDVVDPVTVKFTLARPMPEFLYSAGANIQYSIFSKKAIDAGADWNKPNQVYSGPFMLKEYVPKDHLVLVKNPNYWKKGYPKFDEIYWSFTEDATAGVAAVESSAADVYSPVPAKDVPRLKLMKTVQVFEAKAATYIGFGFDRTKPPFDDARVRKAMALLVDPEERTSVCWFGTGNNLYGNFVYDWQTDFFDNFQPYKAMKRADRVEQAKQLLDQAGWIAGTGGNRVAKGVKGVQDGTAFNVTVPYEANWPASECHTQLLQNWAKDAGLVIAPNRYDPGNFWNDVIAGKFQMWHAGLGGTNYVPGQLNEVFATNGAYNKYFFHGSVPEVDALIDKMNAETDQAKKKDLASQINKMVSDQAFVVSDGSQNTLVLTSAKLQGFFPRSDDSSRALILSDMASK